LKKTSVSLSDSIFNYIEKHRGGNRSEFIEELLRLGIKSYKKNKKMEIEL